MIELTNQDVLAAAQQLSRLSEYEFHRKVRYPIDYNLDKLEGPAKRIRKERQKILETYGTPEKATGVMQWKSEADGEKAIAELEEFLEETDEYRLRTVDYDDFGDVAFPSALIPKWFRVMPEDDLEEPEADEAGEVSSPGGREPIEV